LKIGDALSPLFFIFASGYVIKSVQVNQEELKLNATLSFLAYADDVNILGGNVHSINRNAAAILVASKEEGT